MISPQPQLDTESHDGPGAGDHDQPYRFGPTSRVWRPASGALGWKPRASVPYPLVPRQRGFNTRQYGRLLVLRGRVQDGLCGADDVAA